MGPAEDIRGLLQQIPSETNFEEYAYETGSFSIPAIPIQAAAPLIKILLLNKDRTKVSFSLSTTKNVYDFPLFVAETTTDMRVDFKSR